MTTTPALHVGAPIPAGPLTFFPLWTDALVRPRRYRTDLPDDAAVREADGGPQVGQLVVDNPGTKPVLLTEGTLLDGGWQHRTLAHTVVIGARTRGQGLPVDCVEQRRWGGPTGQRLRRGRAPMAVRGALRGLRADRPPRPADAGHRPGERPDQHDVWQRVDRYQRTHGRSETASLIEVVERFDDPGAALGAEVRPLPGQRGVIIGIGGHPALLELVDHPRTFEELWDGLVASVVADALMAPARPTPAQRARHFAQRVADCPLLPDHFTEAGVAEAVAGGDDLVSIAGVAHPTNGALVQASALNVRHELVVGV